MPILNKKQLKDIKKQFRENSLKEVDDVNKNIGAPIKIKNNLRSQIKTAIKKSVNISWNINTGDLVFVKDPNTKKEIVGLVVKEYTDTTSSSHSDKSILMSMGRVLVMTASGKYLYQPSKVEKIDANSE